MSCDVVVVAPLSPGQEMERRCCCDCDGAPNDNRRIRRGTDFAGLRHARTRVGENISGLLLLHVRWTIDFRLIALYGRKVTKIGTFIALLNRFGALQQRTTGTGMIPTTDSKKTL